MGIKLIKKIAEANGKVLNLNFNYGFTTLSFFLSKLEIDSREIENTKSSLIHFYYNLEFVIIHNIL